MIKLAFELLSLQQSLAKLRRKTARDPLLGEQVDVARLHVLFQGTLGSQGTQGAQSELEGGNRVFRGRIRRINEAGRDFANDSDFLSADEPVVFGADDGADFLIDLALEPAVGMADPRQTVAVLLARLKDALL